ncbi:hypothetical protein ANN_03002 [Periplaneta americana]|uniref:J domain-containing protein n=1 Tax=Periplaneta americana TaxID=6978 RepID=A0ABQ8TZI0_PERAM|nr:hypothetical protein ANN_03002 [Periplaneta americana]
MENENSSDNTMEPPLKRRKGDDELKYKQQYYSILDRMHMEITDRFSDYGKLQFTHLLDSQNFSAYRENFPNEALNKLFQSYNSHFDQVRLKNELSVIYSAEVFDFSNKPIHEILSAIYENQLNQVIPEVLKLATLIVTIPAMSASVERTFSALKRIKSYCRSTHTQERLSGLALMSIEKSFLQKLRKRPNCNFNDEVIKVFSIVYGTHYDTLQLPRNCTNKDVRDSFIKLSKQFHPDKNQNDPNTHAQFVKLNEAYHVLSRPDRRRDYDLTLQTERHFNRRYDNSPFDTYTTAYRQRVTKIRSWRRQTVHYAATPLTCNSVYQPLFSIHVAFYKRHLWTFNLTMHETECEDVKCLMWHEAEGGREGNQIGTSAYKEITSLPPEVRRVVLYSEACGRQNKNPNVSAMFLVAMKENSNLEFIDHKCMVSGDSHMKCDIDHGPTEKQKKRLYVPIAHSFQRRNFKIVNVIESEVETTINQFVAYSLALDESTDRNDKVHIAIFIRVNEHFTCLLDVITKYNWRRSFPGTGRHHRTEEVEFAMACVNSNRQGSSFVYVKIIYKRMIFLILLM